MTTTADITLLSTHCALGAVVMAQTPSGVCALYLGDDARNLQLVLRRHFPQARPVEEPAVAAAVASWLEQPEGAFPLPLDLQGSDFQKQVWRLLQAVPAGTTLSYSALAERLGKPAAVRAVASACAANHVAVVVPCHRILRKDGALSGYRWGAERKHLLLTREGVALSVQRQPETSALVG